MPEKLTTNGSKDKKEIIIDLTKTFEVQALDLQNLIHQDAYERVIQLINEDLNRIQNYDPTKNFRRIHNTIVVSGQRGSGKTSFLLTLRKILQSGSERLNGPQGRKVNVFDIGRKVHVFDIVDPTLISKRQNILLLIITLIKREVDRLEIRDRDQEDSIKEWRSKLKKLASGLTLIDTIGQSPLERDFWEDEVMVIERGLFLSKAGFEFERNFHIFIKKSLDILDKEAFVLIFDDIDIDFTKGLELLETLRKFISSPQILTILAGDFSIFTNIVRKDKWSHFDSLIKYEPERKWIFRNQVDIMTEQYLQKLIHAHRRINLFTLHHYLFFERSIELKIKRTNNPDEEATPLREHLENLINEYYYSKPDYKDGYIELISKFPLRTFVQFLTIHNLEEDKLNQKSLESNSLNKKGKRNQNSSESNSSGEKEFLHKRKRRQSTLSKVSLLFLEELSSLGLNAEDLDHLKGEKGLYIFLKTLWDVVPPGELTKFKVPTGDKNKDYLYFLIPNLMNAYFQIPQIIEFLMRITLPILMRFWLYKAKERILSDMVTSTSKRPTDQVKSDQAKLDLIERMLKDIYEIFTSQKNFLEIIDLFGYQIYAYTVILREGNILLLRLIRDRKEINNNTNAELFPELVNNLLKEKVIDEKLFYLVLPTLRLYFPGRGESYSYYSPLINIYLVLKSIEDYIKIFHEGEPKDREEEVKDREREVKDKDIENKDLFIEKIRVPILRKYEDFLKDRLRKIGYEINEDKDEEAEEAIDINGVVTWTANWLYIFHKHCSQIYYNKEVYKIYNEYFHLIRLHEQFIDYLQYAHSNNFFFDFERETVSDYFQRAILNYFLYIINPILFEQRKKLVKGVIKGYKRYLNYLKILSEEPTGKLRYFANLFYILTIHPLFYLYYNDNFANLCKDEYLKKLFPEKKSDFNEIKQYLDEIDEKRREFQKYLEKIVVIKTE